MHTNDAALHLSLCHENLGHFMPIKVSGLDWSLGQARFESPGSASHLYCGERRMELTSLSVLRVVFNKLKVTQKNTQSTDGARTACQGNYWHNLEMGKETRCN